MKTKLETRVVAFVAACLVTFTVVHQVADYAYPEAAPVLVASAPR
jgi:hypothetical protein